MNTPRDENKKKLDLRLYSDTLRMQLIYNGKSTLHKNMKTNLWCVTHLLDVCCDDWEHEKFNRRRSFVRIAVEQRFNKNRHAVAVARWELNVDIPLADFVP